MRFHALLSSVTLYVASAHAIFTDEAYYVDYHHALLGVPEPRNLLFRRPQASSNASLLYAVSDKAVLGAINPRDGSLLWRQPLGGIPLENSTGTSFAVAEGDGKVISGFGQEISAWDALDGKLIWTFQTGSGSHVSQISLVPGAKTTTQDVVALVVGGAGSGLPNKVIRLVGEDGSLVWAHQDDSGDTPLLVGASEREVYFVSKHNALIGTGKVKSTKLDFATGKQDRQDSLSADIDSATIGQHAFVSSGSAIPFQAWVENPLKNVKVNLLGSGKISTIALDTSDGEEIEGVALCSISGNTLHFLVHLWGKSKHWAEIFHISEKNGEVSRAYRLPAIREKSAFTASTTEGKTFFTRVTETEISLYESSSHGMLGRWPRAKGTSGEPSHVTAEVVAKGRTSYAIRIAESTEAGEVVLTRNGETIWKRPEMLAYVNAAAWVDNEDLQGRTDIFEAEVFSNPLSTFIHRIKQHSQELMQLPQFLLNLPKLILSRLSDSNSEPLKNMLGSKTLIVATSRGDVIALDATKAGFTKWGRKLEGASKGLVKASTIAVKEDVVTTYFNQGATELTLNLTDGALIENTERTSKFATLVTVPTATRACQVRVLSDGTPHIATNSPSTEGQFLVTLSNAGEAGGWALGATPRKMWTLRPSPGFHFTTAISRPAHDPVASIGTVLGSRSVLYKHLTPNLALFTATSSDTLMVYLIEAITGTVLHVATHAHVSPSSPIPVLMSENWFTYSFLSSSPPTPHLIITELFDSPSPNSRGPLGNLHTYSAFAPNASAPPHLVSQAFILPEPIAHLAVTQTTQGITSRQLLAYLPESGAIAAIPRYVLDPRRPLDHDPTALEAEEGLTRYSPALEFDPHLSLTHAREVLGVKKIIASPSNLESTSLVFAFGHDIFGTSVAPSLTFDVLGKGFNRGMLILTVAGLGAGVAVMAPFVRRKQVEGRWKGM